MMTIIIADNKLGHESSDKKLKRYERENDKKKMKNSISNFD